MKTSVPLPSTQGARPGWLWRMVGLFGLRFVQRGVSVWAPVWCSYRDEDRDEGFARWELVFFTARLAAMSYRGALGEEPRFYRWHYDGRVRWKLWLSQRYFVAWGRDYEDLPNHLLSRSADDKK